MQAKAYTSDGKESGKVTLSKSIFDVEAGEGLIHRLFLRQRSNKRNSIAHTLTRGERRGSTRKIYRQKGTGRARMGANRSPIRKKGGVVFGPRNVSNFILAMNRKERRKALFAILTQKAKTSQVSVVKDFQITKTKDFVTCATAINADTRSLYVVTDTQSQILEKGANLEKVKVIYVNYLNPADLLKYEHIVFTEEALKSIDSIFNVA